jgi:CheY-like chemotaxis protein
MDMASIDAVQSAVEMSPVTLEQSLQEAMHLVRALADERDVQLQPPAADSAAVRVLAHPLRLRQVFVNLLGNAIKYNRPGGHVALRVACIGDAVRISVADSGKGLTTAQRDALFQPFNRLGAEHGNVEGSGLGLVITRHLLSLMGGSISVDSQPGVGSTFTVQLSRVRGDVAPEPAAAPAPAARVAAAPAACGDLLYVEDNPVNVLLMEAIVGMRPQCRLRVASSGAEAMDLLRQPGWRPDLLLLDLNLPDMSGQALLQQIRLQPGLSAVPALVVSATSQGDDLRIALAAGFADHWMKPLDVDGTLVQLDRWLAPDRPAAVPNPA